MLKINSHIFQFVQNNERVGFPALTEIQGASRLYKTHQRYYNRVREKQKPCRHSLYGAEGK